MTTINEQEENIEYLDKVDTTEDGELTIEHEGVTYSTDNDGSINIGGNTYTMEELNNYEETKKYKPEIVKSIKTAKDAKRYYDYYKIWKRSRVEVNLGEPKKNKKLEQLKDPNYYTGNIKKFANNLNKGFSSIIQKNKNSKSAYIVGALTVIFTTYLFYRSFKIYYVTQYLNTFLFLIKRLFFFIIIITLTLFTYTIILKYIPWVLSKLIAYFILTMKPLTNDTANRHYNTWSQWKGLGTVFLVGAHIIFGLTLVGLLILFFFVLLPFIVLLGYFIGVSLSFMDD
jgi:hypothetical protein